MIADIATHICTEGKGTYSRQTNRCVGTDKTLAEAIGGPLRLSFHDSATYDVDGSSGPDGCIDFSSPDNGGLFAVVYKKTNPATLYSLNELYVQVYSSVSSRADFWAVAANVAVMLGGGPDIKQRTGASCASSPCVSMRWGRVDANSCPKDKGRLPSSQLAHQHILDVFQTRLNFTNKEIVALMGGHTVGHVSLNNSHIGFTDAAAKNDDEFFISGRWDGTPDTFDNEYFFEIAAMPWDISIHDTSADGKQKFSPSTFQWDVKGFTQMMLNTDMALVWDVSSVTIASLTDKSGKSKACSTSLGGRVQGDDEYTKAEDLPKSHFEECKENTLFSVHVNTFADLVTGQSAFFSTWTTAWPKLQELGWSNGRKGKLYDITSSACV